MKYVNQDFSLKAGPVPWVDLGGGGGGLRQKINFSELGHAAYQIKGNETYNNILANILPLHTLNSWDGVKRSNTFSEGDHVTYQIKEIEALNKMQARKLTLHIT